MGGVVRKIFLWRGKLNLSKGNGGGEGLVAVNRV